MDNQEFESRILRFELARQLGGVCELADYLTGLSASHRSKLLAELICIDLEYAWRPPRLAEPTTLESYVEKFADLISLDLLTLDLVGEEYRVRRRWGDRPSHAAFLSRFRDRHEPIRDLLLRIDREMDSELGMPIVEPRSSAVVPDGPLLSHGDFLLRRLIGSGGMGKVYEARVLGAGRSVAAKFLRKSLLDRPEVVRRFLGEARTVAKLRHPKIVGTEGLGRTPGGSYFIVMDLVAGPDLSRVIRQRTIAVDEAIRWSRELCEALEHAHERGIVHCDLKPANLLLDEAGGIRVTDFGLARSISKELAWSIEVEGTAPFMAPEQVSSCWGPIDGRTDIYGVGAVLFALLTGRAPFEGRRVPDVLAEVISGKPVISPASIRTGLPDTVVEVCRKCLSKGAEDRFQDARQLRLALESITS